MIQSRDLLAPATQSAETSEMETAAADVLKRLEESTRDASRVQLEVLTGILERNADAGYVRPYHLGGLQSAEAKADAFRRLVPLSSYEDYADIIQRIADGEESPTALFLDPLICFFYSSGTSTLRPKLIPFLDSPSAKASSHLAHTASSVLLRRLFPPRPSVNKVLWFLYAGNVTETAGGFKVMAASAFPFQSKSSASPLLSACISPPEVILGSDHHQQTYCHLLSGLRNSSLIDAIRAPYAAGLVRAIRLLESKWEQLCEDIERGSVSSEISDPSIREAVDKLLGEPRPDIAMGIREACEKEKWAGILRELWPEIRYIACVTTGSMEQYYPVLKYYAGENVPIVGGDYFASECSIGINMDRLSPPELTSFVILPTSAYFEFLPFEIGDSGSEANETVDIAGVEVGKLYEVVVTTYRGLYRYRLGDVVKVVGFHNSSPRVEFTTRAPKEGSEVFTERDLMSGMEGFQLMIRDEGFGEVSEFAGFLDSEASQKHLVVFVELNKECCKFQSSELLQEFIPVLREGCQMVEGCLPSAYKMKREIGDLGPMELSVVKPGSFEGLAMVAFENGAPANQYKPPKILRNMKLIDLLRQSVLISVSLNNNV